MGLFFRLFLGLLFVGAMGLYNFLLVDIRFEDLYSLLGSTAAQEEASPAFTILAEYESVSRYAWAENDPCAIDQEPEIKALLSGVSAARSQSEHDYRLPVRFVVRVIRTLLGKDVIRPKEEDKIINVLEIGYFLERNRNYLPAVKIYNDVLQTGGVEPAIQAAVMMHKAFCISMLGDYKDSRLIFEQVINRYSSTGAGALSWKLLDCVQEMEKRRGAVETLHGSALEKARKSFDGMDFQGAVWLFGAALKGRLPPQSALEAHYYKGMAHEALGQVFEAAGEYRAVRHGGGKSAWAKKADCRLAVMKQFFIQEKIIAVEARKRLAAYRDQKFSERVKSVAQEASQNLLRSEIMNNNQAQDSAAGAALAIGSLDLAGESGAASQQKKIDSIRNALVKGSDTGQPVMEKQHPYRSPTAVKAVIDRHRKELDMIYKKRLKRGFKLSGSMLVEFTVRPNGAVSRVAVVQSEMGDQSFEKEILRCVWAWRFRPVPAKTGDVTIRYPFEFP
jgi:TonB family protein